MSWWSLPGPDRHPPTMIGRRVDPPEDSRDAPILNIQRCRPGARITARGSGVDVGQQLQGKIDKMTIVGDSKWQHHLTVLAQPLDVPASQFFETDDDGWSWLTIGVTHTLR
jgi:hypothetical protein